MDTSTKDYIDSLEINNVPWSRMFTAYGTAEHYPELLSELKQITDIDQWKTAYNRISDFEHQSTLFPPAPFAMVFLVRLLEKLLAEGTSDDLAKRMIDQFDYYVEICANAEKMEHANQLEHFSDLLEDENLLPEDCTEEDLMNVFEDPEAVSDVLFHSFYYYSMIVLSQIPDILDHYKKFPKESKELRVKNPQLQPTMRKMIVMNNVKNLKFELFPLDKLAINDTSIYLGKSKEQFIELLGEPEAVYKNWNGDGESYYYFNSELMFDCDNNSNIRFIEFNGGYEGALKPIIYGVSAFEVKMDELYKILEKHNNGRIDVESDESYGFVETSVGIWKDGANDETDYWTTVGIGEKDCYLEMYESRKQDND